MYDVVIVGGGVVGALCARELAKYKLSVAMVEKEADVAAGASRANSGIVHGGYDAIPGTLKAKFNVEGNKMMEKVCTELGVGYRNNTSLVLAFSEEQVKTLEELLDRAQKNGVPGVKILTKEEVLALEKNISKNVVAALYAPTGGIVCPFSLTIAAVGNAMDNGVQLQCDFDVTKVEKVKDGYKLISEDGKEIEAKIVVNAAGAGSGKIAKLFGDDEVKIGYRKGEYILLDNCAKGFVNSTIFTVPTKAGKGILISPTVDGNVILGPTSIEEDEFDITTSTQGFATIKQKASEMMDNVPFGQTITSFAGVRAYCSKHDFIIGFSASAKNLYNVAGIESPGLTSAPAIGAHVAKEIAEVLHAEENKEFNPIRKSYEHFKRMSQEEKNALIKEHPEYGKIICRCECVSLGEILYALRANPKATTLDGIKLRVRAGMGRCQSGFCQPSLYQILRDEYGFKVEEVTKNGKKSAVIIGGEI